MWPAEGGRKARSTKQAGEPKEFVAPTPCRLRLKVSRWKRHPAFGSAVCQVANVERWAAGRLTNKASMLLKNKEMERAICAFAIPKPSRKPEGSGQKP